MNDERIMTLHPQGKKGVNILKTKYEQIRETMLAIIDANGDIPFQELTEQLQQQLSGRFDGKIIWYSVTVKQDLEARGIIEQLPNVSPQRLRRAST